MRYRIAIVLLAAPLIALYASGCGGMRPQGVARGSELYDTCKPCHGNAGLGNQELGAPAIAGLPRWYLEAQLTKFRSGVRGNHPEDAEGARMRPMARSLNLEGDVASVAEYVATLPGQHVPASLSGGDVAKGAEYYSTVCTVCHGADGMGTEAMGAPTLLYQSDWYMLRQLEKFKTGQRGADSTDAMGQQMVTMAAVLPDHQAMLDVVAYILTLRK